MSILRAASWLSVLAAVAAVAAFAREVVQAGTFGGGAAVDAYLVALALPFLIGTSVVSTLEAAFIPIYLSSRHEGDRRSAEFARATHGWLLVGAVGLAILFVLAVPVLVPWQAPGFPPDQLALAAELAYWIAPSIVFTTLYGFGRSVLNAEQRFTWPALAPAFGAVTMIVVMTAGYRALGIMAVAAGYTAASAATWLTVYIPVLLGRFPAGASMDWKNADARSLARSAGLLLCGVMAMSAVPVVDRLMASRFPAGVISSLAYADRVVQIPMTLVATAVVTAVFPVLSACAAARNLERLRATLGVSVRLLASLLVPIAILLVVSSVDVVRLAFERGAFHAEQAEMTAVALRGLALGLVFTGVLQVLPRAFNAMQLAFWVALSGVLNLAFKIVFNWMLVPMLGYAGFAIATSAMYAATGLVMAGVLRSYLGGLDFRATWPALMSILAAGVVMGVVATFVSRALPDALPSVRVLAAAATSSGAYLGVLSLLSGRPGHVPAWLRMTEGGHGRS